MQNVSKMSEGGQERSKGVKVSTPFVIIFHWYSFARYMVPVSFKISVYGLV